MLLLDDDAEARRVAAAALESAQIPVRVVGDGKGCLAAMAAEKPDVLVMEPALSGSMPGKDVINMIKATMEWVDIRILLYTRLPIGNEAEARTIHGADAYVSKGPKGAEAVVAQVIRLFQSEGW